MKRVLIRAGIVLVVLTALLCVVGLLLPSTFQVSRSVEIRADRAVVHALVGDLTQWDRWTPWKEQDPSIVVTPGAISSGPGASQTWVGDSGDGALVVTTSSPETGITYDLAFDQGRYQSEGGIGYEDLPGGGTRVIWTMRGEVGANPIARLLALTMDSMVGPLFERGLERLAAEAQADAAGRAAQR